MTTPEQQAEEREVQELLPCEFKGTATVCTSSDPPICASCERRPAVAAALGAKDKIIADEHQEAEHYRLEASNVYLANEDLQEEIAQLRSQLAAKDKCSYIGPMRDCPTHGESDGLKMLEKSSDSIALVLADTQAENVVLRSRVAVATDIMKMSKLSLEVFLTRGDFAEDDRPKIKRWLASIDSWIAQAERKE